jgi:hypothetical protein
MDNEQNKPEKPGQLPQNPEIKIPAQNKPAAREDNLPKLRTMKHDAAQYLKDRNLSFLDLVAQEHKQQNENRQKFEYTERVTEKTWFRSVLVLVSLVFLVIIGYAAYVFLLTTNTLPNTEAAPARAFIPVEERGVVTIREHDRAGLLAKLEAARRDRLPSRSIKHVVVQIEVFGGASRFATAKDFFETLEFKLPNGLAENIEDKFDILMYYRPDGADLGLLFKPKDHERALAHMLAWEDSVILDFRTLYFDTQVSQPFHLFSDKIVRNIDTRRIDLINDAEFSYALFAQNMLVIATSDEFMEVLLGRLLAAPPR